MNMNEWHKSYNTNIRNHRQPMIYIYQTKEFRINNNEILYVFKFQMKSLL